MVGDLQGAGLVKESVLKPVFTTIEQRLVLRVMGHLSAADMLNDKVLPWYEEQGIALLRILTDRGSEY